MKHLNFFSKSSSRSCGHRVTTLALTVGSQEEFYVSGGNSRGAFTPADVCQTSSVRLNRFTARRRGAMLRLLSVLVLVLTVGVGQMWGTAAVNSQSPANGKSFIIALYYNSTYYALPHISTTGTHPGKACTLNGSNKVTAIADCDSPNDCLWDFTSATGGFTISYTSGVTTNYLWKTGQSGNNQNISTKTTTGDNIWAFTEGSSNNVKTYSVQTTKSSATAHNVLHGNSGSTFQVRGTTAVYAITLLEVAPSVAYTVTLKDDNSTRSEASPGAGVTLPSRSGCDGYTFAGWTKSWNSAQTEWTTTAPTIIPAGSYAPTDNENLYPVYTKTEGGGSPSATITTSLTEGKIYIFGAVKAVASSTLASNTTVAAVAFTSTASWGTYVNLNPSNTGVINSGITDECKWTLTSVSNGAYTFKKGNNYLALGTGTGGSTAGVSENAAQIYLENQNSTCKDAFFIHPTSTSTNRLVCNTNSNCGYRMYATSTNLTAQMCGYIRFYEYNPGTTTSYISVPNCCTKLGSINGSVSLTQLETPDKTKLKATWTMASTTGIASYTLEVYDSSDNLVKTINNYTSGSEITGLTPCTTYYVKLYTVSSGGSYCDGGLISTSSKTPADNNTTIGYAITIANNIANGSVSANVSTSCVEETITLTPTPDNNDYRFDDWNVYKTGTPATKVTVENNQFTMPAYDVTVSASFVANTTPSLSIVDNEDEPVSAIAFGNQEKDVESAPKSILLYGENLTGDVAWELSGTDKDYFAITPASPITQSAAEEMQEMEITFTPDEARPFTATLTFTSDGATSRAVTLTGTGQNYYTVTFHNGSETGYTTKRTYEGGTIELPDAPTKFDDNFPNFVGWAASNTGMVTSIPTLVDGTETISADADYYAVFSDAPVATNNYKKITESAELTNGKYLIVANYNNALHALENGTVSNKSYYLSDGVVVPSENVVTNPSAAKIWTIGDGRTLYNADAEKYLKVLYADNQFNNIGLDDNSMNLTIAEGSADDAWIIYGVDGGHNIYLSHSTNSWDEFLASANPYDLYLYKQQFASTKWTTRQVVYVTISYDANGATDYEGDLPANAQIESGTDYTVSTATLSREGYNFIGWNTDDEATVGLNSLTNVTSNTTLHAVWEEIPTYDVKFSVNGSVADGLTLNLQEGASITFPKATVPEGSDKKFVGWIEASSYASDDAPTFVTSATIGNADKTYYAVFADEASSNYTKVTSEPEDWSGEYILAYDNSATEAFVFDGTDKASDYVTAKVSEVNSKSVIASLPTGGATITIAKIPETTNYSIMVNGGDNNGKYLKGGSSTSNTMSFEENAIANGISWGTNGIVFEYNSSYMRFNNNTNNYRFRYYKSSTYTSDGYEAISLYKHAATYTAYVTTVAALDHIAITTAPKVAYKKGEALDLSGMVVTAYFGTGEGQTSKVVTNYTASPANGATLATTDESVTISYLGEEASQTIHVYALSGIALSGTHKTTYKSGETVDATNLVVTATWGGNAADKIVEAVTGYTIDLEEALTTANNKYTVTYTHEEVAQTADQAIHVYDLSGIAVTTPPTKETYNAGESFDATDMVVTATWGGNATDKIVEAVTGYATDPATLSNDTENDAVVDVTISYTANGVNKTTTQQVTVHPLPNLTMTWDVAGTTTTSKIYINAQDKYLLVLPENDPDVPAGFGAGYVFKGWTNAASVAKDGSDFVKATAGTEMTEATTFHAVFALKNGEDAPAGYRLVNAAPANGETVIFARKVNNTYYAFNKSAGSSELTITDGVVTSTTDVLWDAKEQCNTTTATGLFYFVSGQTTNLIHINTNTFNITNSAQNGDIVFSENGDGSFTAARRNNTGTLDRWISANGTNAFGVTSTESSAVALYVFKYSAATVATYSNYRFAPSSVVAPEITLAEGTYYGVQSTTITQSQSKPIYYTLDGTNPTKTSTLYDGAISLNEAGTKTIKAVAYDEATDDYSAFDEATYTIVTEIANPVLPASGKFYTESKEVEISHELISEGAEILYSYDGVNYSTYSSALNITETKTVYAKATIGSLTSEVVSATYTKGVVVNYNKLTSTDQLAAGMEFILVSVGGEQYVTAGALNSTYLDTLRIAAPVENVLAITRDVKVFTLDGQPAAWTMTSEDGTLFSHGDKKVNYSGNGDGTWNLTFSGETLTIANNGSGNGNLRYNTSSPRFTTYSGQTTVDIYYKEYATAYTLTYDVDGTENDKTVKVVEGYEYTIVNNVFGDAPEGGINAYWKDADNKLYSVGDKIILTSNMTLTPVWSQVVRGSLTEGKMGTICPKQEVKAYEGASFYELSYKTIENGMPYKVFFDEIAEGASLEAGKPYLFVADGEAITGVKVGDEAEHTAGISNNSYNGFYGILTDNYKLHVENQDDVDSYKYYIITNNEIRLCGLGDFNIPAERAYINMSALTEGEVAQAPGRRRVCLTNQEAQVATGMENAQSDQVQSTKVLIDGQLFIIRCEKMYNANGQVVK